MIDRELVTRKLVLVQRDLDALAPYAAGILSEYLASRTNQLVVERLLERIIGRLIDVNFHLLTESGQAPPSDYYASFVELATIGVLDPVTARRIASCAGLRNRIVHEYDEIDPTKVHAAIRIALEDIPLLMRSVSGFVDRER
jgi:uncharacterized protein YutE (UPF0331/DUF86 family)